MNGFEPLGWVYSVALALLAIYWLWNIQGRAQVGLVPLSGWWGLAGWWLLLLAKPLYLPALFGIGSGLLLYVEFWPHAFKRLSLKSHLLQLMKGAGLFLFGFSFLFILISIFLPQWFSENTVRLIFSYVSFCLVMTGGSLFMVGNFYKKTDSAISDASDKQMAHKKALLLAEKEKLLHRNYYAPMPPELSLEFSIAEDVLSKQERILVQIKVPDSSYTIVAYSLKENDWNEKDSFGNNLSANQYEKEILIDFPVDISSLKVWYLKGLELRLFVTHWKKERINDNAT